MKKNLTKKLMLSVLTLAFAVVSLGASTFAWFTVGKDANVDTFEAQVVSGAGIEIAVGAINSSIKADENGTLTTDGVVSEFYIGKLPELAVKKAVLNSEDVDGKLWPQLNNVSTAAKGLLQYTTPEDGEKTANVFDGTLYGKVNNATAATVQNNDYEDLEADDNFYAFKLYVRSEQTGKVTLNNFALTRSEESTAEKWAAGVSYFDGNNKKVLADQKVSYNLVDAARLGIICPNKTQVYQAPAATGEAIANGSNSQGFNNKGALEVYNQKYEQQESEQIAALEGDYVPSWESNPVSWTDASIELEVTADAVYEIEVYIWIEGYDAECYNAIFGQILKAQFTFTWVENQ